MMKRTTGGGARKKNAKPTAISYRCASCDGAETIPAEVIAYFDATDPGLPGQPATFQCQRCPGIMYPVSWLKDKADPKDG